MVNRHGLYENINSNTYSLSLSASLAFADETPLVFFGPRECKSGDSKVVNQHNDSKKSCINQLCDGSTVDIGRSVKFRKSIFYTCENKKWIKVCDLGYIEESECRILKKDTCKEGCKIAQSIINEFIVRPKTWNNCKGNKIAENTKDYNDSLADMSSVEEQFYLAEYIEQLTGDNGSPAVAQCTSELY